jgi:hypothetical protein
LIPPRDVAVDVRRDHRPNRLRRGLVCDHAERFGGAALKKRIGIGQRVINAGAAAGIADEAHGKRGHLPHFRVGLGLQRRRQGGNGFRQLHSAGRERRSAAECALPGSVSSVSKIAATAAEVAVDPRAAESSASSARRPSAAVSD